MSDELKKVAEAILCWPERLPVLRFMDSQAGSREHLQSICRKYLASERLAEAAKNLIGQYDNTDDMSAPSKAVFHALAEYEKNELYKM